MKILGISLGTILLVIVAVWIGRKWGSSIPLINAVG